MAFLTPNYEMDAVCLHCKNAEHDKIYVLWIEAPSIGGHTIYVCMAGWGRSGNDRVQAQNEQGRWSNIEAARRQIEGLVASRERKEYVNLTHFNYHGGLRFDYVLAKVTIHNLSRADSFSTSTANVQQRASRAHPAPTPAPIPVIVNPGQHRSRRLLET
ncbi:MAG: hypothetical protein WCI73_07405 [Phycisphaerae bacterium]